MKQLPWGKIHSNLHHNVKVGMLSDKAIRLLFSVICLTAGIGNPDTGYSVDDILWDAGVDRAAMDECIAAGVLALTEQGTVTLTDLVLPQKVRSARGSESTNPSTLRVRKHRARIAAEKTSAKSSSEPPEVEA